MILPSLTLLRIGYFLSHLSTFALATPTTINYRSPSSLIQKRYPISCFEDTEEHPLRAPSGDDCDQAAQDVLSCNSDIDFAKVRFSRHDQGTIFGIEGQLPMRWTHGTCTIAIDIIDPENAEDPGDLYETATLNEISTRAHQVRMQCKEQLYGGRTTAGQYGNLHVFVAGGKPEHYWSASGMTPEVECLPLSVGAGARFRIGDDLAAVLQSSNVWR
ncbi:hypothetical protein MMC06_004100 [Schaereria dolodes]|nr:hypothetical protein [Schaereria dolodes]